MRRYIATGTFEKKDKTLFTSTQKRIGGLGHYFSPRGKG